MKKQSNFKRGFKANAERLAIEYREKLGIKAWEPLCAFKLADFLSIPIYCATEFGYPEHILINGEWSALTMPTKSGKKIIIHNKLHSLARQQSDLMHELSHIVCNHNRKNKNIELAYQFEMLHYDEIQEEEAKYLGAAFQISKAGLFWSKKRNLTLEEIAKHFNSSVDIARLRMNITGIGKTF